MAVKIPHFSLQIIKNYFENNFSLILCYFAIITVIILTFLLQPNVIGIEPRVGSLVSTHHDWVTTHTLAIISKATPENFFVGYALTFIDDQGNVNYQYFDRYPVFFSAIVNQILSLFNTLAEKLYIARQIMNLIFLGTFILAFLILYKLIKNKPLSLAVTLIVFSNPFLLWYKDMVHFDQPALFGFLLLIYAITLYKVDGLKRFLYLFTFIAVGLGRGYASYSILILWLSLESLIILKSSKTGLKEKFVNILKHPSFHLLIIGIAWGSSLLFYNVIIEAYKRDIPIRQTSILQSAQKRFLLNEDFNQENEKSLAWHPFLQGQVTRIIQWSFPFKGINMNIRDEIILLSFIFAVIGIITWKQTPEIRMIFAILTLSGFVWLIPLKGLTAFHEYTSMYYIGVPLVFFLSIFKIVKSFKVVSNILLIAGLLVYISAIFQLKDWHEAVAGNEIMYVYDFDRILEKIDSSGWKVYITDAMPYGPYTPGFFLSEQYLSPQNTADYIISGKRDYLPNNLTPNNEVLFLFKR